MWSEMLIVKGRAGKYIQQTWQAYTFKPHRIQSWEKEAPLKTWLTDSARGKNSCLSLFLSMSCYRVCCSPINMLLMELSRGYYCMGSYCKLKSSNVTCVSNYRIIPLTFSCHLPLTSGLNRKERNQARWGNVLLMHGRSRITREGTD